MPLEPEEGAEGRVPVAVGDHLLDPRPGFRKPLEAEVPVALALALHRRHVVPARMSGEGEEVQMAAGNVERALDRTHAITMRVVVVDVAVDDAVIAHVRPSGLLRRRSPAREGSANEDVAVEGHPSA
jgi:hypothetical protein